jgi:FkbM family methyltransferase
MTNVLSGKWRTALRVLRDQGAAGFSARAKENITMWRHRRGNCALLEGCLFELEGLEPGIVRLILLDEYEHSERAAARAFLDPASPVIELGACLGVVSCIVNRMLKNPDRHVAVEANPRMVERLRRNGQRNGSRFAIVDRAIAYDDGPFHVSDNVLASGMKANGSPIAVAKINIREIAERPGFAEFTLICDVEGTEVEIVEQEGELLSQRCRLFMLETHESEIGEAPIQGMRARLEALGFCLARRIGHTSVYNR